MDFRRELSTVSLPTRERAAAKSKFKELTSGQQSQVSTTSKNTKQKRRTKVPPPTLASTRQPRTRRAELTFKKRKGGLVMQGVLRHDDNEPSVPPVPYLPGQEDIPHFDEDVDADAGADADVDVDADINADADLTEEEEISPEMAELLGRTDICDEDIDTGEAGSAYPIEDTEMQHGDLIAGNDFSLGAPRTRQALFGYSEYELGKTDFLGNVSPDDVAVLFGGLNSLNTLDSTENSFFDSANNSAFALPALIDNRFNSEPTPDLSLANATADTNLGLSSTSHHVLPPFVPNFSHSLPTPPNLSPAVPLRATSPIQRTASAAMTPALRAMSPALRAMSPALRAVSPSLRAVSPSLRSGSPGATASPAQNLHPSSPSPVSRHASSLQSHRYSPLGLGGTPARPQSRALSSTRSEVPVLMQTPTQRHRTTSQTQALVSTTRANATYNTIDNTLTYTENETSSRSTAGTLATTDSSAPTPNTNPPPVDVRQSIPLVQDIERNIVQHYQLTSRIRQVRRFPLDNPLLPNGLPRAGALSESERKLMQLIEFHLLYRMLTFEAWFNDSQLALEKAVLYGEKLLGKPKDDIIVIDNFELSALSKLSSLRSDCLQYIFPTVSRILKVVAGNRLEATGLMSGDAFLYVDQKPDPDTKFRCEVVAEVLLDIFFRSSKKIGLPFILELCAPDDRAECASWHKQLRDRTATQGLSVGAIAFAATTIYYTLDKMARNVTKLHFNDQGYKRYYEQYFRDLVKLPHLGVLRNELLDKIKREHLRYWPAADIDEETAELDLAW
ncbi:hypothetical protein RhiJN_22462 [Ceratobasidium sp. AG-Ba]|nr:hypothetical protein RhiJN_16947 [Ceratobasidium sp. AG-Ba]QRV94444.1 hypothetical protein RhiJN_22462 [Ceratobasidium sp. AG-Ba]